MDNTLKLAKIIWDYMILNQPITKADCIIALGNSDLRTASRAAELYNEGYGDWLVTTGGYGRLTKNLWNKSEARMFADVAIKAGVPKDKILIENRAPNTFDNFRFALRLLEQKGIKPRSLLIVTKPYMERRAYAMAQRYLPDIQISVASPKLSFEDYPTEEIPRDLFMNIMVGDLQRIKVFGDRGELVKQEVPKEVMEAYDELIALGYDKQLIKTEDLPEPGKDWT
jgi:uncharacterized SAM-binding protein YcdF (DUF218 family)